MANRIKELRENKDLSQEDLAELVNTSGATISRLESGDRYLSEKWVRLIAGALGCHPGEIFEPIGEKPSLGKDQQRALETLERLRSPSQRAAWFSMGDSIIEQFTPLGGDTADNGRRRQRRRRPA